MIDLIKRMPMLKGEMAPISKAKKNGIEKIILKTETKKENSNAEREKRTFFWDIAEAAERNADIKAIKNQFIFLPVNLKL